mmetsp:Transcript_42599/g.92816  ORF Transcript_42599/g.92816 Transcript_42599/m.92816 type:complete len:291 (-) Transcript_42599:114-986(-)
MLLQFLAECATLARILPGLLQQDAAEAIGLDDESPTLVVEVLHDDTEALVLLADEVGGWHLDIVKLHIRGAAWPHALAVHALRRDPWHGVALQQQHGYASHACAASSHCHGEVVRKDPICDPLLVAIDEVEVPLPLGSSLDVGHVAPRTRLSDVQANDLLAHEACWSNSLDHVRAAEVQHWRKTNLKALYKAPQDAAAGTPRELIDENHLVEVVKILRCGAWYEVICTRSSSDNARQKSCLVALDVCVLGNLLVHLPLADVWQNVGLHEVAATLPPILVRLRVIRAIIGL